MVAVMIGTGPHKASHTAAAIGPAERPWAVRWKPALNTFAITFR